MGMRWSASVRSGPVASSRTASTRASRVGIEPEAQAGVRALVTPS